MRLRYATLRTWGTVRVHPVVFGVSSVMIVAFVLVGALFTDAAASGLAFLHETIIDLTGWFYILMVGGFLIFVIWLYFSRYGVVRLGRDDEAPEYTYFAWFSMLFSAGMGIGLLFFSVAEPIMHYANPPRGLAPETVEAARQSMTVTFFHWGFHAWAIYIIVAISLAYFSFRHGLPLSLRSALYPLIGRRIYGLTGDVVDILAVFGTIFGIATSLGLGVMQINAGLEYLGILDISVENQLLLISLVTIAATISVALGLDRGIRRLSEFNLATAGLLIVFVLLAGPTVFLLSSFVQNVGLYASSLPELTFRTDAFIGLDWQRDWTMFYWAWWISWSPFVGLFIARISRGRTIREFIAGVMLVPTALTFFFLTVFGDTALYMQMGLSERFAGVDLVGVVRDDLSTAIFAMLGELPLQMITTTLATVVIAVFFVTSADSGSLVIDTITSGDHPDRGAAQRIFWSLTEGAIAAVLLVTGGLVALQTAAITTALPLSLIMLVTCVGLTRGLRAEAVTSDPITALVEGLRTRVIPFRGESDGGTPPEGERALAAAPVLEELHLEDRPWQERLDRLLDQVAQERLVKPTEAEASESIGLFLRETVLPAFDELSEALEKHGREVQVESGELGATLFVLRGGKEEFAFGISGHVYHRLDTAFPAIPTPETGDAGVVVVTAEVVLRGGRQEEVEIRKWSREAVIESFLDAYSRWMGW